MKWWGFSRILQTPDLGWGRADFADLDSIIWVLAVPSHHCFHSQREFEQCVTIQFNLRAAWSCLSAQGLDFSLVVTPTNDTRKIVTLLNCSRWVEFFLKTHLRMCLSNWFWILQFQNEWHQHQRSLTCFDVYINALSRLAPSCAWSLKWVGFLGSWFMAPPVLFCDEFYIFLAQECVTVVTACHLESLPASRLTLTAFLQRPCAPSSSFRLSVLVSWVNPGLWLLPPPDKRSNRSALSPAPSQQFYKDVS